MHLADALTAHVFEGVLDGFPLRIEDGLLWCDDNRGFHVGGLRDIARHGLMLSEGGATRQFFLMRPGTGGRKVAFIRDRAMLSP
jgi:hypothetical protein